MRRYMSTRRARRRQRKDTHKHSHSITDWLTPENFKLDAISNNPIKVTRFYAYKGEWDMTGTIMNGKIRIRASNNGEYRSGFLYESDKQFTLADIDWVQLYVELIKGDETIGLMSINI